MDENLMDSLENRQLLARCVAAKMKIDIQPDDDYRILSTTCADGTEARLFLADEHVFVQRGDAEAEGGPLRRNGWRKPTVRDAIRRAIRLLSDRR